MKKRVNVLFKLTRRVETQYLHVIWKGLTSWLSFVVSSVSL